MIEGTVFSKVETAPANPDTLLNKLNLGIPGYNRGASYDENYNGLETVASVEIRNEPRPKSFDGYRMAPDDNPELARLFEEEQADLTQPALKSDGARLERHRARVARVRELYAQNKLQTGADYYRAALLLLRGEGPEDYRLGRELNALAKRKGWGLKPLQTGPEQDCSSGIPVCQSTYTQTQSYTGVGGSQEAASGTCLGGESNSVWYIFTAQTSGSLFFTISTAKDYDFALYNITNGGCAAVPGSKPIRCNYSAEDGQTGLKSPAAPETPSISVGSAGSQMMNGVIVTAGQTYALLVNNFTGDQNGYTLKFSGTASITDTTPPRLLSASMDAAACEIEIITNEPVKCSSIAVDGSDFNLYSSGATTVTGARGIGCGAFTNRIRLTYSINKSACSTWAIVPKKGTDGNTLLDNCQNALTHLGVVPVPMSPPAVARLSLPADSFCTGVPIVADGSASMGEARHFWSVVKSDANMNVTGPEYSDWFAGPAGSFDLSLFASQKGLTFECEQYYRIKLAVGSCCTPWHETVKLVKFTCQGATSAFTLPKTQYCPGENIIADGSPSQNETNHFWSIQESDQAGHVYGEEIMGWFTGPAGSKNLTQFAAVKNFELKCNTYYRIKLAVAGCGSPWHETTKLIRISYPEAGPDRPVCCNTGYPVQIGSPATPGVTYSWTSNPAGFSSSFANPVVTPTGTTVYTLTATGPGGCTTTNSVKLTCLTDPDLKINMSTGWNDWRIRAVPGTLYGTPPPPALSVKPLVWISSWATTPFATWISPQVNPDGTAPILPATLSGQLDYYYEYRFYLDLTQFTNPKIEINEIVADNTAAIYLNSQVLWGNPNNFTNVGLNNWIDTNFTTTHGPFQITSGFINGWNTLLVRVRNGGGPWGPSSWSGLLIRGEIRASCK